MHSKRFLSQKKFLLYSPPLFSLENNPENTYRHPLFSPKYRFTPIAPSQVSELWGKDNKTMNFCKKSLSNILKERGIFGFIT